ncbi:RNA polymerase sigma factor [Mucilaginibacter sp. R-33]|uniref:RNA polymerase sigma factor n=1 Tax=Mucilaginibacter sp. R-33 TaxID=3416711 RepID=UPI003CF35425
MKEKPVFKANMNNCNQLTTWWEEALHGNVKSFGRIHDELYSGLYFYLYKIIKDEDAAQDVLQELFIKMWERRITFGPIKNVKYYFFKSARSLAINFLKAARPEFVGLSASHDIDIVFSREDVLVLEETGREVEHMLALALNTLPKRQKEMIFLRYFDNWNYDQIAEVTGLQYQSVVNHVHRGINQLRIKLSEGSKIATTELVLS